MNLSLKLALPWVLSTSLLAASVVDAAPAPPAEMPAKAEVNCSYAREYITALEYLRSHSEYKFPEKGARELAMKVSRGCSGSAQRFIKITATLSKAGVLPDDSIQSGLQFVQRTDKETESFLTVFLKSYLQDYLDLTVRDSLALAKSLTLEFQGDIQSVRKDFERVVQFCVGEKDLNLPRPACAALATRIAKVGENYSGGVAENFIQMFTFLSSEKGPNLTRGDALTLAEKLLPGGKDSAKNLIQAYRYAVSSHGLDLPVREALSFAQEMVLPQTSAN